MQAAFLEYFSFDPLSGYDEPTKLHFSNTAIWSHKRWRQAADTNHCSDRVTNACVFTLAATDQAFKVRRIRM
jgi:hypothetical protein